MNNNSLFTQQQFERKKKKIMSELLGDRTLQQVAHPTLVLLCGQPGAGKSNITELYQEKFKGNVVVSDIDEYRRKHPHFVALSRQYPNEWSPYCQDFASTMGKEVNQELANMHYNVIIDGTLKNIVKTEKLIQDFKSRGFAVEIAVVATKPDISTMGIISRYAHKVKEGEVARNVPLPIHNMTVEALPSNLTALQKKGLVDGIYIFNRDKKCLYDSNLSDKRIKAGTFLQGIYKEPLTEEEKSALIERGVEALAVLPNNDTGLSYSNTIKQLFAKYTATGTQSTKCSKELMDLGVNPSKSIKFGSKVSEGEWG